MPDLAASIQSRLPISPTNQYAAYPLVDERPPIERPPWEPRTRFEMERDISELRNTQRRLGDSVAWIVDTLLQDEGDAADAERVKAVRERKREAVECLAYVRDVLKGSVVEIEEERLVGEEEFRRRKVQKEKEREKEREAEVAGSLPSSRPSLPRPVPLPSAEIRPVVPAVRGQPQIQPHTTTARSPPKFGSAFPPTLTSSSPAQAPSQQKSASAFATVRRPSAPPQPTSSASAIAPWNHTRSNFSIGQTPIAGLPRIPPPTSTTLPRPPPAASSASPSGPPDRSVGTQNHTDPTTPTPPRRVQQDPLGALP